MMSKTCHGLLVGANYRMIQNLNIGKWCVCDSTLAAGDELTVMSICSPNRVIIETNTALHKVRASTLRRVVEDVNVNVSVGGDD